MRRNKVILVNESDAPISEMDKIEAHEKGLLHRAFSVFIFNSKGEMLIHQRAATKYHGANLWTNACCSHPQPGEELKFSALERLHHEMGLTCTIDEVFSFVYKVEVENGLIEHEYDHVFVGHTDNDPLPNPIEVQDYQWVDPVVLLQQMREQPEAYTSWFKMALPTVMERIK